MLLQLFCFNVILNMIAIIDKIVKIHDYDYNIIYEFEDFYKYNTKRLIPLDREILENAIELYCEDHKLCFHTYGFSSFWDVSDVFYMDFLFCENTFNGDISNWDVSNVTNMSNMFHGAESFDQDISGWMTMTPAVEYYFETMFINSGVTFDSTFPYLFKTFVLLCVSYLSHFGFIFLKLWKLFTGLFFTGLFVLPVKWRLNASRNFLGLDIFVSSIDL